MHFLKLLAISLFIFSCSVNSEMDDITPSKDVLITKNDVEIRKSVLENKDNADPQIKPRTITGKTIEHVEYEFIIGESSKSEFDSIPTDSTSKLMAEAECVKNQRISITSEYEIDLKLTNGTYFTLKKEEEIDEQFFGYSFEHFNETLNIYVLWENWLEAGHPIMVNGTTGKITPIFGFTFASNKNQTLTANVAVDIGAGWTPNGLQVFDIQNNSYIKLFEFDPTLVLNEEWGPVDLKFKNDNTIVLECVRHNDNGGYITFYKVVHFWEE